MKHHSINETILKIHDELRKRFPNLRRVALAVYESQTDSLKTFAHSTDGYPPLAFYDVQLSDVPSLKVLAESGQPRVIDDLSIFSGSHSQHSQGMLAANYKSSYTEPLVCEDLLLGFLFFDADCIGYFDSETTHYLSSYAKMLTAVIAIQFASMRTLNGAVSTAIEFSRHRDEETAMHLKRMACYSRLIAIEVAQQFELDDEDVEFIYRFSELHDIGKIAIPDSILFKQAKLTPDEYEIIKTHVTKGREMADMMTREFGLDGIYHIRMLKNIISYHHERFDGSGYPEGLAGDEIPVEARIVAIADVFDSLTCDRPYKQAWTVDEAINYLQDHSGVLFEPVCVEAVTALRDQFSEIHSRYHDEPWH